MATPRGWFKAAAVAGPLSRSARDLALALTVLGGGPEYPVAAEQLSLA